MGHQAWLVIGMAFVVAMMAADLTEKTGALGAAIGLHFANNVFAILVVSVKDKMDGLSLFVTEFDKTDMTQMPGDLALNLLTLLIVWWILRNLLDR